MMTFDARWYIMMSITVPACVEAIADGAFEGSGVFRVELPEGLMKIGNRAFADCTELTEIEFPKSLRMIGSEAFAGCVHLDAEAPEKARVGNDAFKGTRPDVRKRKAAEEAERKRKAAEEAERRRKAAEEAERKRREAEEAERKRKAAEEAERKRREAEKAERRRREAEEAAYAARLRDLYNKGKRLYDNEDYEEAIEYLREAADQGHTEAQYILGYSYISAQGVGYNSAEAKRWFRKAAEGGHALAKSWLNDMNQWGW